MYGDVLATMARHSALDTHNNMRPFTTLGATLLTGVSALLFAAPLSAHPGMGVSSEGMPAGHPAVTKANRQLFDLIAGGIAMHRDEHEFAANAFYDAFRQTPSTELAEMAWQAAVSARDSDLVVQIAEEWLKIDPKSEIAQQSLLARDIEKETVGAVRDRLAVMYRNAEDKVAWTARMTELLAKSKLSYAVAKNLLEPYQSRHRNAPQVQLASAVHAKMNSRYEEACRLAASAQKGLPDDEETVSLAADICWPVARKETQSMLERFLKRHPDADTVRLIYGRVLARAGQKEAALREADRATKGDIENPNLLYTAGLLANEARAPEEALAYFRRYVKYLREESPGIDLSHTDVWLQIGQTALALERPAEAAEAFAELKAGPFARQARLNEARAWAAAGEIDKAIEGAQIGILFNQGQVCCAGSRIFVQEGIYDEFVAKLVEAFKAVKVGDPMDMQTQMGSQINKRQLEKILGWVETAKKEGATVLVGGEAAKVPGFEDGAFMQPTLLGNVTNDMAVAQNEIFGPVAVVIKFRTEEEVVAMANDSEYGLGGAVWTRDINRALRVARSVRTGRMWVNTYNELPAHTPFGGYKKSGIGRETHKMMLEHYSQHKNIYISLSEAKRGFF